MNHIKIGIKLLMLVVVVFIVSFIVLAIGGIRTIVQDYPNVNRLDDWLFVIGAGGIAFNGGLILFGLVEMVRLKRLR